MLDKGVTEKSSFQNSHAEEAQRRQKLAAFRPQWFCAAVLQTDICMCEFVCVWGGNGDRRGFWGQLPHRQRVYDQPLQASTFSVCLYLRTFSTNIALHTNSPTFIYPFSADSAFACFVPSFGVLEIVFMVNPAWVCRDLQLLMLLLCETTPQSG